LLFEKEKGQLSFHLRMEGNIFCFKLRTQPRRPVGGGGKTDLTWRKISDIQKDVMELSLIKKKKKGKGKADCFAILFIVNKGGKKKRPGFF